MGGRAFATLGGLFTKFKLVRDLVESRVDMCFTFNFLVDRVIPPGVTVPLVGQVLEPSLALLILKFNLGGFRPIFTELLSLFLIVDILKIYLFILISLSMEERLVN